MELAIADSSCPLKEQRTIQQDDLRGTGDRVFRQPGGAGRELDVPGCLLPPEIARERDTHDGLDAATIEAIPLNHNDRATWRKRGSLQTRLWHPHGSGPNYTVAPTRDLTGEPVFRTMSS